MRRFVGAFCAVPLALIGIGCSGVQTLDTSTVKSVTLAELAEDPPAGGELFSEGSEPIVIRVPSGETVPLAIDVDLPFMALESGEDAVRFERDVYLFVGPGQAMISFDGVRFARIGDWDAIKEIAGVKNGTLSVGFGVSEEEGPLMSVALGMK